MKNRKILMVIGCHRSGTSALSGLLGHLGWMSPKSLMPGSKWNEKGYFESTEFRDLHDEILADIERPVFDLRATPDTVDFVQIAGTFASRIESTLEDQFGAAKHIVLKDPRLCRLFPLWDAYAKETDVDLRIVLPLRHPFEVAQSLGRRNGFSLAEGLVIWLREVILAIQNTRGKIVTFTTYDALLTDSLQTAQNMLIELGLGELSAETIEAARSQEFVTTDLRHQKASADMPALQVNWVVELALTTYELLTSQDEFFRIEDVSFVLDAALLHGEISAPGPGVEERLYELQSFVELLVAPQDKDLKMKDTPNQAIEIGRIVRSLSEARREIHDLKNTVQQSQDRIMDLEEELLILSDNNQELQHQLQNRSAEIGHLLRDVRSKNKTTDHLVLSVPSVAPLPGSRILVVSETRALADELVAPLNSAKDIFVMGQSFHCSGSQFNLYEYLQMAGLHFHQMDVAQAFSEFKNFEGEVRAHHAEDSRNVGYILTYADLRALPEGFCAELLKRSKIVHYQHHNILRSYLAAQEKSLREQQGVGQDDKIEIPTDALLEALTARQGEFDVAGKVLQDHPVLPITQKALCTQARKTRAELAKFLSIRDIGKPVTDAKWQDMPRLVSNYSEVKSALERAQFQDCD